MKKNTRFIFALTCILALALFQSCDDSLTELEKLPPATQSGKRTFGCLVNGKAAKTQGITDVSAYYQTGTLFIHAGLGNSLIQLHIYDLDILEITYQLSERKVEGKDARFYDGTCDFFTTNDYLGTLTITHLDKVNYIISGRFEFNAYSTDCTKVIKVTEGRFDIHYAP